MKQLFLSLLCIFTISITSCSVEDNQEKQNNLESKNIKTLNQDISNIDLEKLATEYTLNITDLTNEFEMLVESEAIYFSTESYEDTPRQPTCQHGTPKMGHKVYNVGLAFHFVFTTTTVNGITSSQWSISMTPISVLCPY